MLSSRPIGLIAAVAILGALSAICLCLLVWIFIMVKKGRLRQYKPSHDGPPTRPDPSLISNVLHSNGIVPSPGLTPVPFHVSAANPHSPSSPKSPNAWAQREFQGQSPSTFIHSNGVPASYSNTDSMSSRLSSLGPIGVSAFIYQSNATCS